MSCYRYTCDCKDEGGYILTMHGVYKPKKQECAYCGKLLSFVEIDEYGVTINPGWSGTGGDMNRIHDAQKEQAEYLASPKWAKEKEKIRKKGGRIRYGGDANLAEI